MAVLCSLYVLLSGKHPIPDTRSLIAENQRQTVCKPGSVPAREGDGRPFIWDARHRTPRATYPDSRRGNTPVTANRDAPSLFGLAPGGVYLAADVAAGAVRSYRTLSPLPANPGLPRGPWRAVGFLWH